MHATPWYAWLGAAVAVLSLLGAAVRVVRWARALARSIDRLVDVLDGWPEAVAAIERQGAELVEYGVALGRVDAAQRKNRRDVDELWRRFRNRFPDERPLNERH